MCWQSARVQSDSRLVDVHVALLLKFCRFRFSRLFTLENPLPGKRKLARVTHQSRGRQQSPRESHQLIALSNPVELETRDSFRYNTRIILVTIEYALSFARHSLRKHVYSRDEITQSSSPRGTFALLTHFEHRTIPISHN